MSCAPPLERSMPAHNPAPMRKHEKSLPINRECERGHILSRLRRARSGFPQRIAGESCRVATPRKFSFIAKLLALMASAPAEQFVEQPEIEAAAIALVAALGGGAGAGFVAAVRRLRLDRRRWREPAALAQSRQCRRRDALMRGPHEPAPDFHRQTAADRFLGRRIVVIAEP